MLPDLVPSRGSPHWPQPGNANDCAIESAFDQLTRVHGLALGDPVFFRDHVRAAADLAFGTMIDVVGQGPQLLAAIQGYLTEVLGAPAPPLELDVWMANRDEGLTELQRVARADGEGAPCVMTFYYNGINHFDSITGDLARH